MTPRDALYAQVYAERYGPPVPSLTTAQADAEALRLALEAAASSRRSRA